MLEKGLIWGNEWVNDQEIMQTEMNLPKCNVIVTSTTTYKTLGAKFATWNESPEVWCNCYKHYNI